MSLADRRPRFEFLLAPLLNLRIRSRLILAFSGVFILMLVLAGYAGLRMVDMKERLAHVTQSNNQQIAQVTKMIYSVSQRAIALRIENVGSCTEHRDAGAGSIESASVRRSVYAQRQAADDSQAGGAETAGKLFRIA